MVILILVIKILNKEFIRSWLCSRVFNLRINNLGKELIGIIIKIMM